MTVLIDTRQELSKPSDLGPLYQDYAYGYPHKSAYRTFDNPPRLADLWQEENKDHLFLYLHLPFCEMRCGFCNLFTAANPIEDIVAAYLKALTTQMRIVREEIGHFRPVQMALGGGTPTLLSTAALADLLDSVALYCEADPASISAAIETSPQTVTHQRMALLAERGFERISIGVQSFDEAETRVMGRTQKVTLVEQALDTIRNYDFARLNIDLIYGAQNQTPQSFVTSLRRALAWQPEEIFLYPLYIRTLTGLDGRRQVVDEHRRQLYRAGRDFLLSAGYYQVSMRAFHRMAVADRPTQNEFSCQEDGVVGLGTGARSYTGGAHYSSRYAVSRGKVLDIIKDFTVCSEETFRYAEHGFMMDKNEAMRRFMLKSIMRSDGLDRQRFFSLFDISPEVAFPVLTQLEAIGLLCFDERVIRPTASGLEHGDAVPPLFYSRKVRQLMDEDILL
ncbi:MAG: STM4012 family radical SAM protein [Parahaliea sp.]